MSNTPQIESTASEEPLEGQEKSREPMLLILANHERSIRSTASFLTRRGVPARYITSLNEAIEAFTAKEANMLLLSINFPHPKIEMIPTLINQSFNIEVIAFAEETDRRSSQRLQNVKTRHVIQGPVSGPTVLMRIRQIEKELAGDSSSQPTELGARGLSRITDQDQSINVRGGSLTSERITGDEFASGQTYVQKGERTASHLLTPQQAFQAALDRGLEEPGRTKAKLIVPLPMEMRRSPTLIEKRAKFQRRQQASEHHAAIEVPRRKKPESDEEDLFQRCLIEAVMTVVGEPDDSRSTLSLFRKAMLVAVRSPRLKAAFLIGVGVSKHKPADLMERVQVAFFSLMRANGVDLSTAEQFSIELDETSLARRAFSTSNHILICEGGGTELGVAVVTAEDPVPELVPYEHGMLKVPLKAIPENEPVPFNIFIHLKRNRRFFRYVRSGSKLSSKQVVRLERFNVNYVLVDGKEREAYTRHYAAHSIQPSKRRKSAA